MPPKTKNPELIKQRLAELEAMDIKALKDEWHRYFDYKPPRYQREYMLPRIAYHVQALALGGLSQNARNKLKRLAFKDQVKMQDKYQPSPGTRLVREWNGKRYDAIVCEDGFEYDGKRHKSLSNIAEQIVGCKRSGPEFFGLTGESK